MLKHDNNSHNHSNNHNNNERHDPNGIHVIMLPVWPSLVCGNPDDTSVKPGTSHSLKSTWIQ